MGVVTFCPNEKERTHAWTVILRRLSYMWCPCRGALRAAFRCSALRTTRRPEVCRYRVHRGEIDLTPDRSENRTSATRLHRTSHCWHLFWTSKTAMSCQERVRIQRFLPGQGRARHHRISRWISCRRFGPIWRCHRAAWTSARSTGHTRPPHSSALEPLHGCTVSSTPFFSSACKIVRTKLGQLVNTSTILIFDT